VDDFGWNRWCDLHAGMPRSRPNHFEHQLGAKHHHTPTTLQWPLQPQASSDSERLAKPPYSQCMSNSSLECRLRGDTLKWFGGQQPFSKQECLPARYTLIILLSPAAIWLFTILGTMRLQLGWIIIIIFDFWLCSSFSSWDRVGSGGGVPRGETRCGPAYRWAFDSSSHVHKLLFYVF
jgi:hypothetical protein